MGEWILSRRDRLIDHPDSELLQLLNISQKIHLLYTDQSTKVGK
jgi:hypothetical protein